MTNNNLIIITVSIIAGILAVGYILKTNNQPLMPDDSQPNSELTVPYGSDNNSTRPNEIPREVERGTVLNPDVPQLTKPEMTIDTAKDYKAVVTTSKGAITIDLLEKTAPNTVNNFVYLANNQFYNDVIFHRIIKGFMIQGGDPTGTGTGDPGYKFDDEPFEGEYTRGTVAMANAGPNTNGSQFFIMHGDTPLPKNYVIFGKVTEGLETVDAIAESEVKPEGEGSSPVEPTVIKNVEIIVE